MSPQEAYQLWNEFIKPLSGLGYKLVSPAVTAAGIDWMKTFLGLCNGQCEVGVNFVISIKSDESP